MTSTDNVKRPKKKTGISLNTVTRLQNRFHRGCIWKSSLNNMSHFVSRVNLIISFKVPILSYFYTPPIEQHSFVEEFT